MKKYILIVITILLIVITISNRHATPTTHISQSSNQATATPAAPSHKTQHPSLTDPTSERVIVNKQRPLQPKSYTPSDLTTPNIPLNAPGNPSMQLRAAAARALEQLVRNAGQQGINLMLFSGYRSYDSQVAAYQSEVAAYGQAIADQESARPGFSEHQTGWAVDVEPASKQCEAQACFADMPEGKWVAASAYKYGFIVRYPEKKQSITGYTYEPWHLRYVGPTLAANMQQKHILTLEEYFNLPAALNY